MCQLSEFGAHRLSVGALLCYVAMIDESLLVTMWHLVPVFAQQQITTHSDKQFNYDSIPELGLCHFQNVDNSHDILFGISL